MNRIGRYLLAAGAGLGVFALMAASGPGSGGPNCWANIDALPVCQVIVPMYHPSCTGPGSVRFLSSPICERTEQSPSGTNETHHLHTAVCEYEFKMPDEHGECTVWSGSQQVGKSCQVAQGTACGGGGGGED